MAHTEKESRKTAEEAIAESRRSLPKDLENDLRAIGRVSNKNHCEINDYRQFMDRDTKH